MFTGYSKAPVTLGLGPCYDIVILITTFRRRAAKGRAQGDGPTETQASTDLVSHARWHTLMIQVHRSFVLTQTQSTAEGEARGHSVRQDG